MIQLKSIFEISKRDDIPTYVAADRLAEERIERIRKSRSQFLQNGNILLQDVNRSKHTNFI